MKIHSWKTVAVRVDFEGVMAGAHIVLRLRTDAGIEGVSYVSRVNPRTLKPLKLLIDSMAESLVGCDPTDTEAIYAGGDFNGSGFDPSQTDSITSPAMFLSRPRATVSTSGSSGMRISVRQGSRSSPFALGCWPCE